MTAYLCGACGAPCRLDAGIIDDRWVPVAIHIDGSQCRGGDGQPMHAERVERRLASPEVEAGYPRIGEEPSWAYDDDSEPGPEPTEWDEWRESHWSERQADFEACQRGGY